MGFKDKILWPTITGAAGTIVAAIIWRQEVGDFFWHVGQWLWNTGATILGWVGSVFDWLGSTVTLYAWWSLFLHAVLVAVLTFIAIAIHKHIKLPKTPPVHFSFTETMFRNVLWRWEWSETGEIVNLIGYCPTCKRRAKCYEDTARFEPDPTEIFCNRCNKTLAKVHQTIQSLKYDVQEEIHIAISRDRLAEEQS